VRRGEARQGKEIFMKPGSWTKEGKLQALLEELAKREFNNYYDTRELLFEHFIDIAKEYGHEDLEDLETCMERIRVPRKRIGLK
jgi:hypothetical protein